MDNGELTGILSEGKLLANGLTLSKLKLLSAHQLAVINVIYTQWTTDPNQLITVAEQSGLTRKGLATLISAARLIGRRNGVFSLN